MKVTFETKSFTFDAEFNSSAAAQEIVKHLPIYSVVFTWGDEIYFDTEIKAPSDGATGDVDVGDVAYWPQGKCLCIFFGPTPASSSSKPVPASEVVIVGKTQASVEDLRKIPSGENIRVKA